MNMEAESKARIQTRRYTFSTTVFVQCFDAVGWAAGRASGLEKTEWWGAGMVICLQRGADLRSGPADASATHCLLLQ